MIDQPTTYNIDELLFHQKPMLLIKQVTTWNAQGLEVMVDPMDSAIFFTPEGKLPSWVGIEYMAQAIGALSGIFSKQAGHAISMGFLLGTRKFSTYQAFFDLDKMLKVRIKEILRDETNLVLFDCAIYVDDVLIAQAELKAIQPPNLEEMFEAWGIKNNE
jgi:predicted hotdog family 3-hydroxylacyl-ACP dehydratase